MCASEKQKVPSMLTLQCLPKKGGISSQNYKLMYK